MPFEAARPRSTALVIVDDKMHLFVVHEWKLQVQCAIMNGGREVAGAGMRRFVIYLLGRM